MSATKLEQAVQAAFTDEALRSRIVSEGPVALADILEELEAREAARSLGGRVTEIEHELVIQRATNGWL